jgi:hypothetical protein
MNIHAPERRGSCTHVTPLALKGLLLLRNTKTTCVQYFQTAVQLAMHGHALPSQQQGPCYATVPWLPFGNLQLRGLHQRHVSGDKGPLNVQLRSSLEALFNIEIRSYSMTAAGIYWYRYRMPVCNAEIIPDPLEPCLLGCIMGSLIPNNRYNCGEMYPCLWNNACACVAHATTYPLIV